LELPHRQRFRLRPSKIRARKPCLRHGQRLGDLVRVLARSPSPTSRIA
jgi:hypothetical protein